MGYSYLRAIFDGYRDGTDDLSNEEVLFEPAKGDVRAEDNFPVLPTEITQQAHILEVSYSMTEKVGFSLLLPYIHQSTDHISILSNAPVRNAAGDTVGFEDFSFFVISSSGIGDISLSASYLAWHRDRQQILASLGLNLPTGSIDELEPTPRVPGTDTQLPYTMQIGSGTIDLVPSVKYGASGEKWT